MAAKITERDVWRIRAESTPRSTDVPMRLFFLLQFASGAPSLFNCQPWLMKPVPNAFLLLRDTDMALPAADPGHHAADIACGAAFGVLEAAAHATAVTFRSRVLDATRFPDHLAYIEAQPQELDGEETVEQLIDLLVAAAAPKRFSRGGGEAIDLKDALHRLSGAQIDVAYLDRSAFVRAWLRELRKATRAWLRRPGVVDELLALIRKRDDTPVRRGLEPHQLGLPAWWPMPVVRWSLRHGRGLATLTHMQLEYARRAEGFVIITSQQDDRASRVDAGRRLAKALGAIGARGRRGVWLPGAGTSQVLRQALPEAVGLEGVMQVCLAVGCGPACGMPPMTRPIERTITGSVLAAQEGKY